MNLESRFVSGLIVLSKHIGLTLFFVLILYPIMEVGIFVLFALLGQHPLITAQLTFAPFPAILYATFADYTPAIQFEIDAYHYSFFAIEIVALAWLNLRIAHGRRLTA